MKYCDCKEYCSRGQWILEPDGSKTGWYLPYLPDCFGGPEPYCKKAANVEDLPTRYETRAQYEERVGPRDHSLMQLPRIGKATRYGIVANPYENKTELEEFWYKESKNE